ncbi:MAG: immune inhibitor A [Actinomycetota bacterium]|nr:immune inhibitor A [Actinomycetota bacterium]
MSLALAAGLGTSFGSPAISATPTAASSEAPGDGPEADAVGRHDKPNPLEEKRRALREEALTQVLNGDAKVQQRGPSTVVKVGNEKAPAAVNRRGRQVASSSAKAQYVELSREATDRIFVVVAEFGDERHPDYPDKDIEPSTTGPVTWDGPLHNAIPKPDRSEDNSTVWQPNYDQQHFQDIYFGQGDAPGSGGDVESVRQYYERQSSGRYSVDGTVTDWVKVDFNEARYGRSSDDPDTNGDDPKVCASVVCSNTWNLVDDAVDEWVKNQRAAGMTRREIRQELRTFDVWDRYDYDGDGDFNEPDGYIDHFQVVHAGGDEADGDPIQGEDAIWSHRWYTQTTRFGAGGPHNFGGSQLGGTGFWVGDYTIQPENGGMSVFAHEYGHDLGLPDLYDTSGGGSNSVEFWSMMAQSRESDENDQGIGTRGADLGAWEKLQLGWLDYEIVRSDQERRLRLGPHEYNSPNAQGAVVVLPKKQVTTELVAPFAGETSWWSGTGDDLDNSMSREITLPSGPATLNMQANYDIETDYDYAYVEVDDGSGWAAIPGSITSSDSEENNGIEGTSDGWVPARFDLSAYVGKTIGLRLRYRTDGAVAGNVAERPDGFFADDITVTSGGETLFESGAEAAPEGWTLNGFSAAGATFTEEYDNYYLASHRDYVSFDKYLQSGPYNFGFLDSQPNRVEHFPYQDGLLISYWDTFYNDNNTSQHPGEGMILPVDANPRPIVRLDGEFWRSRVAGYDAPFSREKSDSFTLHVDSEPSYIRGQAAQPLFRDNKKYWYAETPTANVKVPDNGVNIKVVRVRGTNMDIRIWNRN